MSVFREILSEARRLPPEVTPISGEVDQPKKLGRPKGKRSNPGFCQSTIYIRKATQQQVKARLLGSNQDFSELVEHLLLDWLDKQE